MENKSYTEGIKEIKRIQELQAEQLKLNQKLTSSMSNQLSLLTSNTIKGEIDMSIIQQHMKTIKDELSDTIQNIANEVEEFDDNSTSLLKSREVLYTQLMNIHKDSNGELSNENKLQSDILKSSIDILDYEIQQNNEIKKRAEQLEEHSKQYDGYVNNLFGSLEAQIDKLPNADKIKELIGFEDIQNETTANVGNSLKDSFNKGETGVKKFKKVSGAAFKGVGKVIGGLGKKLVAGLGPVGIIMGVVSAIKKIFELSKEIDKSMAATAEALGVSKEAAHGLNKEFNSLLMSQETGRELMAEYRDTLGALPTDIGEASKEMYSLAKGFNLGNDGAGKLAMVATQMGHELSQVTELAAKNTIELQKGGYAGISLRDTLKDVSEVSGSTRASFKGNLDLLTKQVVAARKLGTTLDTLAEQKSSLLDVESSLSDEIEAQVLLGRDINLDKARQLALSGDLAGMGQELVNQVGDITEFNKMDGLQKKAIAAAVGSTVEGLQEQLTKISVINELGDLSLEQAEKLMSSSEKELLNQKGISKEQLQQYISSQKTITLEEQQQEITQALTESLQSNLPGMQNLIMYLSDLGNRISQVGLVRAVFGGGKSDVQYKGSDTTPTNKSNSSTQETNKYGGKYATTDAKNYGGKYITETKKVAPKVAGDFISRPNQDVQYFSDKDIVLATKNEPVPLNSMLGSSPNMDSKLDKMITLLTHINNQLTKPANITIGNKTIKELHTQLIATRNMNIGIK